MRETCPSTRAQVPLENPGKFNVRCDYQLCPSCELSERTELIFARARLIAAVRGQSDNGLIVGEDVSG